MEPKKLDDASIDALVGLEPSFQEKLLMRLLEANPKLKPKIIRKLGIEQGQQRHPYYSEDTASSIKHIVDEMIESEEDVMIRYSDYHNWSGHTVRLKIFNGISFLVENMDDTSEKYLKWWNSIKIGDIKEAGVKTGLFIRFTGRQRNKGENELFIAHKLRKSEEEKTTEPSYGDDLWKKRIEEFIQSEEEQKISMKELKLSNEDKDWIRNFFSGLEQYIVIVKTESIFLQKLGPNMVFEGEKVRIF